MKYFYLISYSVSGIKTLDHKITLSFYKKTLSNFSDTQNYNIKGIYGMNGSGKSGIITSIDILKNILINPNYLNNPLAQKTLDELINKNTGELYMEVEYVTSFNKNKSPLLYRYGVMISKDISEKYVISNEELSYRKSTSKSKSLNIIYKIVDGEIVQAEDSANNFYNTIVMRTANLLSTGSMCSILCRKYLFPKDNDKSIIENSFLRSNILLFSFGMQLHVYVDQPDDHRDYLMTNSFSNIEKANMAAQSDFAFTKYYLELEESNVLNILNITNNIIQKDLYEPFTKTIEQLYEFLHIFKSDLKNIEIDRKENKNLYICDLIMVYDTYKIHAEFESTGIKKLIRLFVYLREMVHGGIVFIDEFDSNLHDVYLCALLEYMMEYGQGQLCFTTHNVGPMDILKRNKKSIDFLSIDHQIYPWTANGNYSPSKLYKNGMIEGSPFNIDAIDFIGVFGNDEEEC